MADILEQGKWVLLTVVLFLASLAANEWFFAGSEFVRGINWIYLPAGVRLICTLLFGVPGMLGLLVASWIACFGYFFPDDFMRWLAGGLLATCAPCLAYLAARRALRLGKNLANLSGRGLLACIVLFASSNAGLHHGWTILRGAPADSLQGLWAMFVGDALGALAVCYAARLLLALLPGGTRSAARPS